MSNNLGTFKRGKLFILSAPSGTGKTTLVRLLTKEFPQVVANISYTSRTKREGEQEGVDYHYISRPLFEERLKKGEFLEHANVYGELYGSEQKMVEKLLASGKHVFLVIETQGALQVCRQTEAVTIFVFPPSLEELEKRLAGRRTETAEQVAKRISWAENEMKIGLESYDYQIINESIDQAYDILRSIVIAESHRL